MTEASDTIACQVSPGFARWLEAYGGAVAVTTYQAGKVVLVGWDGARPAVLLRHFPRPMGLAVAQGQIALATLHDLTLFANAPLLAADYHEPGRYDALFLPRCSYHTGELNLHDLAFAKDGLWAVNTRFSCLCQFDPQFSFIPRWQPPFISELAPEDRCHLNGLALVDGQPRYVTALGQSDSARGWTERKADGGVLLDMASGEPIRSGLCMPHSPRWRDERIWLLNSGRGELLHVDPRTGSQTTVCALPGYLRGLCFVGHYALIGMSQVRERHLFAGLPVQARWPKLSCGVALVDTRSGEHLGSLEFSSGASELYDVQLLPGLRRPTILNLEKGQQAQAFVAPDFAYLAVPAAADSAPAASTAEPPQQSSVAAARGVALADGESV